MIRSWGVVTLGSVAVPWFGDATTAAVALPPVTGEISVTVASTTRYKAGDRIVLDPELTNQDILLVDSVSSSTVLKCRIEGGATPHTHLNGALIMLSIACMDVIIQNLSTADDVYLGTDNTVVANGGSMFYDLGFAATGAKPVFRIGSSTDFNTNRSSDGWMIGTSGQTVAVSAVVL